MQPQRNTVAIRSQTNPVCHGLKHGICGMVIHLTMRIQTSWLYKVLIMVD